MAIYYSISSGYFGGRRAPARAEQELFPQSLSVILSPLFVADHMSHTYPTPRLRCG